MGEQQAPRAATTVGTSDARSETDEIIDILLTGSTEGEEAPTAEQALIAICMAAQEDVDFDGQVVLGILRQLGLEEYWSEALALAGQTVEGVKVESNELETATGEDDALATEVVIDRTPDE